jgi:hypothetical protein
MNKEIRMKRGRGKVGEGRRKERAVSPLLLCVVCCVYVYVCVCVCMCQRGACKLTLVLSLNQLKNSERRDN